MNLTRNITNKVKCICQITKGRIYSIIEKYNLTEKQLDDFTLKLDILGVGAVTQALAWPVKSAWLSVLMIIISFAFCAIIWTITFIVKGYKNE